MPSDESKGNQLDAIGSLAQRQLDNTVGRPREPSARIADATDSGVQETRVCRHCVAEFYHAERNHQGLGNELITPLPASANDAGPIVSRERLGGILNYYCRAA